MRSRPYPPASWTYRRELAVMRIPAGNRLFFRNVLADRPSPLGSRETNATNGAFVMLYTVLANFSVIRHG